MGLCADFPEDLLCISGCMDNGPEQPKRDGWVRVMSCMGASAEAVHSWVNLTVILQRSPLGKAAGRPQSCTKGCSRNYPQGGGIFVTPTLWTDWWGSPPPCRHDIRETASPAPDKVTIQAIKATSRAQRRQHQNSVLFQEDIIMFTLKILRQTVYIQYADSKTTKQHCKVHGTQRYSPYTCTTQEGPLPIRWVTGEKPQWGGGIPMNYLVDCSWMAEAEKSINAEKREIYNERETDKQTHKERDRDR